MKCIWHCERLRRPLQRLSVAQPCASLQRLRVWGCKLRGKPWVISASRGRWWWPAPGACPIEISPLQSGRHRSQTQAHRRSLQPMRWLVPWPPGTPAPRATPIALDLAPLPRAIIAATPDRGRCLKTPFAKRRNLPDSEVLSRLHSANTAPRRVQSFGRDGQSGNTWRTSLRVFSTSRPPTRA